MVFGFGGSSKAPSRPMKYPYTLTAKVVQFPFKFYFKNCNYFRYWIYSVVICMPIFYWIQTKACSPANTKKWEEIRRKEREEALERFR